MSARTDLTAALKTALPAPFKVLPEPPTSAARFPKHTIVTVQRPGLTPSPVLAGWANALAVYIVVPHEGYDAAETELEARVPTVVAAIEARGLPIVTIDRDVFFDSGDGYGYHGYRILTTTHTHTP